ncbi:hypothetical protein AAG906_014352 [Vitis piasezkii]
MDLRLSSFSSPCHPVLIAYSSLSFHISFSLLMTMSFEFTIRISFFLFFRVVRLLLIFDVVFRVTFGDVLEGA